MGGESNSEGSLSVVGWDRGGWVGGAANARLLNKQGCKYVILHELHLANERGIME